MKTRKKYYGKKIKKCFLLQFKRQVILLETSKVKLKFYIILFFKKQIRVNKPNRK